LGNGLELIQKLYRVCYTKLEILVIMQSLHEFHSYTILLFFKRVLAHSESDLLEPQ